MTVTTQRNAARGIGSGLRGDPQQRRLTPGPGHPPVSRAGRVWVTPALPYGVVMGQFPVSPADAGNSNSVDENHLHSRST